MLEYEESSAATGVNASNTSRLEVQVAFVLRRGRECLQRGYDIVFLARLEQRIDCGCGATCSFAQADARSIPAKLATV